MPVREPFNNIAELIAWCESESKISQKRYFSYMEQANAVRFWEFEKRSCLRMTMQGHFERYYVLKEIEIHLKNIKSVGGD